MLLMIGLGLLAVAGAVLVMWNWVVEAITAWLHNNSLSKSALMDAWVRIERVGTRFRARVFAKRERQNRAVRVEERILERDEIDDEDVLRELERRRSATRNVMHLIE